jgi:ribosomal protein S18 acetylase RimI-like enzyme
MKPIKVFLGDKELSYEIIEYNENKVDIQEVKKSVYWSFLEQQSLRGFAAVHQSLKNEYAESVYLIYAGSILVFYLILFILLTMLIGDIFSGLLLQILAIGNSFLLFYWLSCSVVVSQIYNGQVKAAKAMQEAELSDIKKFYMSMPEERFWVAVKIENEKEKKTVIGTVAIRRCNDQCKLDCKIPVTTKVGYLEKIGVGSNYRGYGIMQRLLEHGIEYAKKQGYQCIMLAVPAVNQVGREMYKSYGFTTVGAFYHSKTLGVKSLYMMKMLES